ncbi:MAG: DUF2029 domain-containing protein [Candidatus Aegiribacteria sp.]|nr:DUF2029 domain-containing protein [Candidatus Aegiribacteria sp.]MBD3293943.1 DUF2029 domain-containing protein [Candidatus Fermentibacteria bacterium]
MTKRSFYILSIVLILTGLCISVIRVKSGTAYYPADLASYLSGYYAFIDGGNPYSEDDAGSSLEKRGISVNYYPYVYSPAFLLLFFPLKFIPYSLFRILWVYGGLFCGWISVALLLWKLDSDRKNRTVFLLGSFVFFTIAAPLVDNSVWGNISAFILLAISVMVTGSFRGIHSSISMLFLSITKIGLLPVILLVRSRKTLLIFLSLLILLNGAAIVALGFRQYSRWANSLENIGQSVNSNLINNLSVANSISKFVSSNLITMDLERASRDHVYRLQRAEKQKILNRSIYYAVLLLSVLFVVYRGRKEFRRVTENNRNKLLSVIILCILVLVPFIWVHYGLFLIIPFWVLCRLERYRAAILFLLCAVLWGMPIEGIMGSAVPVWGRFVFLLPWIYYFLNVHRKTGKRERSGTMSGSCHTG